MKRLLDQGVKPENIALTGTSMGGSVSAHVMNYYFYHKIRLNGVHVSNTFSSTTNVGLSYVRKIPVVGQLLGFILRPVLAFGLWGSEWQMDTAYHYANLPEELRDHSQVRSEKFIRDKYHPVDDPVIDHFSSLHESWRLRLSRFLHKHGWFGYDASTYDKTRRSHKMSVFHRDNNDDAHLKFAPKSCGHSEATFNYGDIGLVLKHRGETDVCEEKITGVFPAIPEKGISESTQNLGFESGEKMRHFFSLPKEERIANRSWKEKVYRSAISFAA